MDKDSPGKKEVKNDHDETKTTEEEMEEADSLRLVEDEKREADVSGLPLCTLAEGDKLSKEASATTTEIKSVQVRDFV